MLQAESQPYGMHVYLGPHVDSSYRGYSMLLLKWSEHILYSKEGVTEGPLSMLYYVMAVLTLICSLKQMASRLICCMMILPVQGNYNWSGTVSQNHPSVSQ